MNECVAAASSTAVNTISIPAGSFVINSRVSVPNTKVVVFQGTGTVGPLGTGSSSTIIDIQLNRAINLGNTTSRVTQIAFTCTAAACSNIIEVSGKGWRIDHNTCSATGSKTFVWAQIDDVAFIPVTGLIDNNHLNRCRVDASGDYIDSGLTWHEDPGFGDLHAVYMEDNTLNYRPIGWNGSDCQRNGRIVVRHNVVTGTSLETHGYQGAGGCRRSEFYRNTMIANGYGTPPLRMRGGPMLIFENTFSGFASGKRIIALDYPRDVNRAVSGGPCDGTNTTIDGNTMGLKGWPCRDQIGTWMDSAAGRPRRWRSQSTRASAFWSNAGLTDGEIGIAVASRDHIRRCRDVMNTDANNDGTCVEGTANKGVGVGPRSSRPATCTAGVYWWAVDQGGDWDASTADTTDGALDYCSATNTWVNDYYIPARYPHPLQGGN